jgi:predicted HD phosphohydrolase
MEHGTPADFQLIASNDDDTLGSLASRLIDHLLLAKGDDGAYQIDRLQHALQTAARAQRMGADDDWVFGALMHDIGDTLSPDNHANVAAEIIAPYVRPEVTWTVRMHGLFQGIYYWRYIGRDASGREKHRDHPFFEHCVAFCHLWDQNSFDPTYTNPTIDDFRPLIKRICERKPFSRIEPQGLDAMGVGSAERDIYQYYLETAAT